MAPRRWCSILSLALVALLFPSSRASQAVMASGLWYVAPGGNDAKDCASPATACASINGALANPGFIAGDTVKVATGVYTGSGPEVALLNKSVALSGGWDSAFTVQLGRATIDGGGARGITIPDGVSVTVERFTIQNSSGGIAVSATVAVRDSRIVNNSGTGISIDYLGNLTVENSVISGNSAGGIANLNGNVTLNRSTVSGNHLPNGSGGGIFTTTANRTMVVNNSTVSGNEGIGIYVEGTGLLLNNTTVSNNGYAGLAVMTLGGVTIRNTILANNAGRDCLLNLDASALTSLGYNLVQSNGSCPLASSDLVNIDPRLGPLQDNGGITPTQALLPGSPALNAGDPAGCLGSAGLLTTDQRGYARSDRCDIGAYEVQRLQGTTIDVAPANTGAGGTVTYGITVRNASATPIANIRITDTLPASLMYLNGSLSASDGSYAYSNGTITWNGAVNAAGSAHIGFTASTKQAFGFIDDSALIDGAGEVLTRSARVHLVTPICNLTKSPVNPVLAPGAANAWDGSSVFYPGVLKEGNAYKMWYTGRDSSGLRQIGYAASTDGVKWAKYGSNPVLSPSQPWEGSRIYAAKVIADGGIYKMWYVGYDSNKTGRIGYATSPDGITWTKYAGNPVLNIGAPGSWESVSLSSPTVVKDGSIFHLWYTGNDGATSRIGHATSIDGVHWIKDPANPVLDVGNTGGWDWLHVYAPSVVLLNGEYVMWYSGETLPAKAQTGYATSSDGIHWDRGSMLIPTGSSGAFDMDSADYSSVIADGLGFQAWYSGATAAGTYSIGYATAAVCGQTPMPIAPTVHVNLPFVTKEWSDPSVCPSANPYYIDSFSDSNSGWPIGDYVDRDLAYLSGEYQVLIKQASLGYAITPGAKAWDYAVAATVRRAAGNGGAYGIVFGINEDWSRYYEFLIGGSSYSVWKNAGSWTALQDWTSSPYIGTGGPADRLKVVRTLSTEIDFYVNDHSVGNVYEPAAIGLERVGVAVNSSAAGLDVRFDDFSLYPSSCGSSARVTSNTSRFEMGKPEIREVPNLPARR